MESINYYKPSLHPSVMLRPSAAADGSSDPDVPRSAAVFSGIVNVL